MSADPAGTCRHTDATTNIGGGADGSDFDVFAEYESRVLSILNPKAAPRGLLWALALAPFLGGDALRVPEDVGEIRRIAVAEPV